MTKNRCSAVRPKILKFVSYRTLYLSQHNPVSHHISSGINQPSFISSDTWTQAYNNQPYNFTHILYFIFSDLTLNLDNSNIKFPLTRSMIIDLFFLEQFSIPNALTSLFMWHKPIANQHNHNLVCILNSHLITHCLPIYLLYTHNPHDKDKKISMLIALIHSVTKIIM